MELVAAPTALGQRIQMRCAHDAVAIAAEMVGAMLIGNEKQEVGLAHGVIFVCEVLQKSYLKTITYD
jgi:hypothetical protein